MGVPPDFFLSLSIWAAGTIADRSGFWRLSANQARVEVRIHIAAGQNDHDRLALGVDVTGEQSGKADRPARLNHKLELAEGEGNGGADFGLRCGDALGEQLAVDGKGDLAGNRGHQRIADAAAFGIVRLAL